MGCNCGGRNRTKRLVKVVPKSSAQALGKNGFALVERAGTAPKRAITGNATGHVYRFDIAYKLYVDIRDLESFKEFTIIESNA